MNKESFRGVISPKQWDHHNISFLKKPLKPISTPTGKVLQAKLNFDFRFGIEAMLDEIKKMGVELERLKRGNYVVFVNHAQNAVRMLTIDLYGDPVIAYKRMPKGRFLDLRVVTYLPQAFNGKSIDLDHATEMALDAFFSGKKRRNPNVLLEE